MKNETNSFKVNGERRSGELISFPNLLRQMGESIQDAFIRLLILRDKFQTDLRKNVIYLATLLAAVFMGAVAHDLLIYFLGKSLSVQVFATLFGIGWGLLGLYSTLKFLNEFLFDSSD